MNTRVHDEASEVTNESGEVLVSGPDGVAVSFTSRAAAKTGKRLQREAKKVEREVESK